MFFNLSHSPFRIHRCDVNAGRGPEGQGRGPGHDLIVGRPRPLRLTPRQRGQLQVARETPATAPQVDAQRAGRGRERLTEAAVWRLSVVLGGGERRKRTDFNGIIILYLTHLAPSLRVRERKTNGAKKNCGGRSLVFQSARHQTSFSSLPNKGRHRLGSG